MDSPITLRVAVGVRMVGGPGCACRLRETSIVELMRWWLKLCLLIESAAALATLTS